MRTTAIASAVMAAIVSSAPAAWAGIPLPDGPPPATSRAPEARAAEVLTLSARFLDARDSNDWNAALALAAPDAVDSLEAVREPGERFNSLAGPRLSRRFTSLTWSRTHHGPAGPGLYALVDYVAVYRGVPHDCGWLLWRSVWGGPFELVQLDRNVLTKRDAARLSPNELKDLLARFRC